MTEFKAQRSAPDFDETKFSPEDLKRAKDSVDQMVTRLQEFDLDPRTAPATAGA